MSEPPGHRGHPTRGEVATAMGVRAQLQYVVERLQVNGLSELEAIKLVADHAYLVARSDGESWHSTRGALVTVSCLLDGRAGKQWSLHAIAVACGEVNDLMERR